MGGIGNRLSKLEQAARAVRAVIRFKSERDGLVHGLARVAAGCASWQEVAAYLKTLASPAQARASADEQPRNDAVREAIARTLFEETRTAGNVAGGEHGGN